jgi:AraC-like DNA-binding protein
MRDESLAADALLGAIGVAPEQFEQSGLTVDVRTLTAAVRGAFASGAGPEIAIRMGASMPLQALGLVGQLLAQCSTLRSALSEWQRFIPLLSPGCRLSLLESDGQAVLHYEPAFTGGEVRRFEIELALSWLVSAARQFTGKSARPLQVRLPYSAPQHLAEYEAHFRCPCVFHAPSAALVFERSLLDLRQPFADGSVRELLKHQAESLLLSENRSAPLHLRVRAILEQEEALLAERRFRDLARRLGLSRRALRRKLSAEGCTLSGLLENFRKEQALHLLVDQAMPLKQISDRLGFSEPSAFHRAFKRWTGTTPQQFRLDAQRGSVSAA